MLGMCVLRTTSGSRYPNIHSNHIQQIQPSHQHLIHRCYPRNYVINVLFVCMCGCLFINIFVYKELHLVTCHSAKGFCLTRVDIIHQRYVGWLYDSDIISELFWVSFVVLKFSTQNPQNRLFIPLPLPIPILSNSAIINFEYNIIQYIEKLESCHEEIQTMIQTEIEMRKERKVRKDEMLHHNKELNAHLRWLIQG